MSNRRDKDNKDSEFSRKFDEMNRADIKKQRKIEKREKQYGHDAPIWCHLDEHGKLLDQSEWFVKLPNDVLMERLYQTQNQFFALTAKLKNYEKESIEYKHLKEKMREKSELINAIQARLANS